MSQSTPSPPGTHPVLACAAELSAALKDVADDPLFMTAEQNRTDEGSFELTTHSSAAG